MSQSFSLEIELHAILKYKTEPEKIAALWRWIGCAQKHSVRFSGEGKFLKNLIVFKQGWIHIY